MYSFPITINNRRESTLEMQSSALQIQSRNFVVEVSKSTYFNLCTIESVATFKTFITGEADIKMNELEVHCQYSNEKKTFLISLSKKQKITEDEKPIVVHEKKISNFYDDLDNEPKSIEKEKLSQSIDEKIVPIDFTNCSPFIDFSFVVSEFGIALKAKLKGTLSKNLFDLDSIKISFQFINNEHEFQSEITIHLAHPNEFLGMALDFGSEASQMVVTRFGANGTLQESPENEDLFRKIKDFHVNKKWIDASQTDFYQEERNTPFYKSIFFLKSDLGSHYHDFHSEKYVLEQSENLKMLVDKSSSKVYTAKDFKQLPNLKITHRQDNILSNIQFHYSDPVHNYPIDISLKQISQKVSNSILKTMIESFLMKEFIQHSQSNRKIRLTLLVPNIYDSEYVQIVQKNMEIIFEDLSKQDFFNARLLAWELVTISESDAAFVGYMSKSNVQILPNSDYVIIDAGKGTTDFSVIKTGNQNVFNVKPIYRNGFAGSGNLITNAIFETLIYFIREVNHNKPGVSNFITEKIIGAMENDLALRNDFFAQLERLKFNFAEPNYKQKYKEQWLNARTGNIGFDKITEEGVDITTVINLLKQIDKGADFYGFVNEVCDVISEKVILELELVQNSITSVRYANAILTGRGFLFSPLADKLKTKISERLNLSLNEIVVLKGNELKDVCIKGVFNRSLKINSEVVGYPIQKSKINRSQVPIKEVLKEAKAKKSLVEIIFGSVENDIKQYKMEFVKDDTLNNSNLQNSEIIIGSNSYSINEQDFFQMNANVNTRYTIDYKRDGYKVRRHENGKVAQVVDLEPVIKIDNPELHMIVPSLFPNYIDEKYLASMTTEITLDEIQTDVLNKELKKDNSNSDDLLFGVSPNRTSNIDDLMF